MSKFTLSKPQRILIVFGVVIFVIGLIWMGYFVTKGIARELNRGIQISFATTSPEDANGPQTRNLAFGEVITQSSGESILTWNNHKLSVFGPATLIVTPTTIDLQNGFAYLEVVGEIEITLNSQRLKLVDVSGLYDTSTPGFIVTKGEMHINEVETAKSNNIILFDGVKFATSTFDRSELQSDKWGRVLNLIATKSQLPEALADLIVPVISNISPLNNTETTESQIIISGTTEPAVTLRIDGQEIELDANGNFSLNQDLEVGINTLDVVATDSAGNQTTLTLTYSRKVPEIVCDQSQFTAQLLCLINKYRKESGLGELSSNSSLNNAAQSHSSWMNANQSLSHDGDNGSTPFSRCNAAGATCDAENVAMHSNPSAQNIFDLWKNSAPHNTNLLGSHLQIGLGISGQYATAVFN
jgi:hypothetical protein